MSATSICAPVAVPGAGCGVPLTVTLMARAIVPSASTYSSGVVVTVDQVVHRAGVVALVASAAEQAVPMRLGAAHGVDGGVRGLHVHALAAADGGQPGGGAFQQHQGAGADVVVGGRGGAAGKAARRGFRGSR